jgi:hypothetical protein
VCFTFALYCETKNRKDYLPLIPLDKHRNASPKAFNSQRGNAFGSHGAFSCAFPHISLAQKKCVFRLTSCFGLILTHWVHHNLANHLKGWTMLKTTILYFWKNHNGNTIIWITSKFFFNWFHYLQSFNFWNLIQIDDVSKVIKHSKL